MNTGDFVSYKTDKRSDFPQCGHIEGATVINGKIHILIRNEHDKRTVDGVPLDYSANGLIHLFSTQC